MGCIRVAVVGDVKRKNLLDVLSCLRRHGFVTKLDIAEQTRLTMGTVNTMVRELVEAGLVSECGIAPSTGGRKAVLYRSNAKNVFIIGVSLFLEQMSVGLFDFDLKAVDVKTFPWSLNARPLSESVSEIVRNIQALRQLGSEKGRVMAVGISVPGVVDFDRGVVLDMPHVPSWRNIPLRSIIEQNTGLPVRVDNDNNCVALYLKWNDPRCGSGDLVYLSVLKGVGVGILMDGKLCRGSRYLAGEIGHVCINPFGEKCSCGNKGCMELFISEDGIVRRIRGRIAGGEESMVSELLGENEEISIGTIVKAALNGDQMASDGLVHAGAYLSLCVDHIIKTYDPRQIVLSCDWIEKFPELYQQMEDRVFSRSSLVNRDNLKILLYNKEELFNKGPAALILEEALSVEGEGNLLLTVDHEVI